MPPKRKTKEEMLEKAKLARRKRYEKIKSDPTLYALEKEKERERYLKRKGQKKILSISDMTPRNRWLQREKWRENFRNYYRRKVVNRENETMNKDTPSCSDNEDSQESDGVDEGTDTARELNTNENVSQDLLIIRNPEPTISKVKQENRVEFEDSAYDKEVDNPKTPGKADNSEEEVLILANEDVSEKKDEHFYWAISCAADIRKMDHVQQIYAKKAIAEILMEGQLGLLHRNSMKLNELSSS
ncbi:unnamed protein product [Diatraea saccharalis]|uniref:Uncharacterized protein n=1 Tax=Diatraea saccharalis TaxID=40085 RepID=A0A9N9R185_9NEOP|nr:unnamed protein product [Diatraea saccharalis]